MDRGDSRLFWSILCFILFGFLTKAQNAGEQRANNGSSNTTFPADFLFGVGSSAYQVEGGWDADGKGETIWDHMVHTRPELIKDRSTGDVACDSYHRFKEDVALVKDVGFNVYRFSISWARILPNGEITYVNQAGVNYYHALIDELLKHGIQPMVTMYHWELPQRFQDMGGWLNPLVIDFMEDYADLLFQLYGEKVKLWITMNEPKWISAGFSFWHQPEVVLAPGLHLESPANYIGVYNVLKAHARIYRLYDKKYRAAQNGKLSIAIDSAYFKAKSNAQEDVEAAERVWAFEFDIFAHPIYSENGDFPEIVKRIVAEHSKQEGRRRSRLPQFTREEIESLKGSFDFFALIHYGTKLITPNQAPYTTLFNKDHGVKHEEDPQWPRNYVNRPVVPWALRELLRYIKDKYNNPPVFITENGCGSEQGIEDIERVNYFRGYLREVLKAKEQFGCNVIGYTAWSLLDNFEWEYGYEFRFGIYDVNFTDPARKRTAKSSAKFFRELLKTRTIPT